ncbi:MAG: PTS fructose transporter subunit IIA [Gemmobacter sp.]|nr:PTS fructose transporter subunit IIA [Gemmobacter sp.]
MIGIVIVAHGGLAREYLAAVDYVMGPQTGIRAISIEPDHDRTQKESEIRAAADSVDAGAGVVVVVDLFGSSPFNLSLLACGREQRQILAGANMPMLLKLAQSRNLPLPAAVEAAINAGRKYIDSRDGGK